MFRPIRRKKNELNPESTRRLLLSERRGVLAMNGEDYPYAVPVNYLYCEEEDRILFHGARAGYKAELLRKDGRVCFTVWGNVRILAEPWAPHVQSAVVFGRCRRITDPEENLRLVRRFAEKYYPDPELIGAEIAASGKAVQMFEIRIDHISGKEVQEK